MARYLTRRLVALLVTLLVGSFLIYALMFLAPGSPLSFLLGGHVTSRAQIAAVKAEYHLNQPMFVGYWHWLTGAIHGDLGTSIVYHQSVASMVGARIGTTALLVGMAMLLIVVFGVGLGILAALKPGPVDTVITLGSTLGVASPSFAIGVLGITVLAVDLRWFPVYGDGSGVAGSLYHFLLPAATLACAGAGYLARISRASALLELSSEHVQTAVARGLGQRTVIVRHVLRNALIPIVTVSGLTLGTLIAGSVIVENVFALNGLGSLLVQAILQKDFPIVQGVVLILVAAFVIINMASDVLYVALDPRLELANERSR